MPPASWLAVCSRRANPPATFSRARASSRAGASSFLSTSSWAYISPSAESATSAGTAAVTWKSPSRAVRRNEAPAAEVDGDQTTDAQLAHDVELFTFLSALNQSTCGTPVEGETQDAACARFTLTNVIQEDLVKHYAAANDLAVDEADVQATVSQLETSLGAEELAKQLKDAGLTRADVEELARRLLLFGRVQTALAKDTVTDEQVQAAYDERIAEFTDVEIAHILVPTEAEAKKIAEEATPKNFASLAADYSQDPGSAQNGGSLGVQSEATYVQGYDAAFMDAALALDVGRISEPVQTQFGWHVIYLKERTPRPLADVADQIRQEVVMQNPTLTLWEQLTPEQRARIIAILVQMLLHLVNQPMEAGHDPG